MTDFSKVVFRCSSLGILVSNGIGKTNRQKYEDAVAQLKDERLKYEAMANKELKTAIAKAQKIAELEATVKALEPTKDVEPLSESAKSMLIQVYMKEKYGKQKVEIALDLGNKYTTKGKAMEEDAITLISKLDRRFYKKNDIRLTDDKLTGEIDVFLGETIQSADYIVDTKCSWDLCTFLSVLGSPLNPLYWWQIQGYFRLSGAREGEVSYCLLSAPQSLIIDEQRKLLYRMNVISEESPEYQDAAALLEYNMYFDDIPEHHRRVAFPVKYDEAAQEKIDRKVEAARLFLSEFEQLHMDSLTKLELSTI